MDKNVIVLKNISKEYKEKKNQVHALVDVTLQIQQGNFIAIMGESGAGKTTLLNIIGLIDKPTNGEYKLFGKDILEMSDNESAKMRNSTYGYILQEYGLIEKYSVYENVEIPLLYTANKISKTEKDRKIREILKKLGIEDKINVKVKKLSGGQRQRVSIARALINQPQIIIADEPTAALDAENAVGIMNLLKTINKNEKITIVIVSHDYKVEEYVDRVIKLEKGRVISQFE